MRVGFITVSTGSEQRICAQATTGSGQLSSFLTKLRRKRIDTDSSILAEKTVSPVLRAGRPSPILSSAVRTPYHKQTTPFFYFFYLYRTSRQSLLFLGAHAPTAARAGEGLLIDAASGPVVPAAGGQNATNLPCCREWSIHKIGPVRIGRCVTGMRV